MLNASFSQTSHSKTSLSTAIDRIIARHLNEDGIVQVDFHEFAPPVTQSETNHDPLSEVDVYDLIPSNSLIPVPEYRTGNSFNFTLMFSLQTSNS